MSDGLELLDKYPVRVSVSFKMDRGVYRALANFKDRQKWSMARLMEEAATDWVFANVGASDFHKKEKQ
jgi:hypothetical protein